MVCSSFSKTKSHNLHATLWETEDIRTVGCWKSSENSSSIVENVDVDKDFSFNFMN